MVNKNVFNNGGQYIDVNTGQGYSAYKPATPFDKPTKPISAFKPHHTSFSSGASSSSSLPQSTLSTPTASATVPEKKPTEDSWKPKPVPQGLVVTRTPNQFLDTRVQGLMKPVVDITGKPITTRVQVEGAYIDPRTGEGVSTAFPEKLYEQEYRTRTGKDLLLEKIRDTRSQRKEGSYYDSKTGQWVTTALPTKDMFSYREITAYENVKKYQDKFEKSPVNVKGGAYIHTLLSPSGFSLLSSLTPLDKRKPSDVVKSEIARVGSPYYKVPDSLIMKGLVGAGESVYSPPVQLELFALGSEGFALASSIPKVAKLLSTPVAKAGVLGLQTAYAAEKSSQFAKAYSEKDTSAMSELFVRTGVEIGGFKLGSRAALRDMTTFKAMELPAGKRSSFFKRFSAVEELKDVPIKEVKFSKSERIPKDAGDIIKEFFIKRGITLGGSLAEQSQLSKSRILKPQDADAYTPFYRNPVNEARLLELKLKAAGISRVSRVGNQITIRGKKAIEFHSSKEYLYPNIRTVEDFWKPTFTRIGKDPLGLKTLRIKTQLKRELVAGYLEGSQKHYERFGKTYFDVLGQQPKDISKLKFFETVDLFKPSKGISLGKTSIKYPEYKQYVSYKPYNSYTPIETYTGYKKTDYKPIAYNKINYSKAYKSVIGTSVPYSPKKLKSIPSPSYSPKRSSVPTFTTKYESRYSPVKPVSVPITTKRTDGKYKPYSSSAFYSNRKNIIFDGGGASGYVRKNIFDPRKYVVETRSRGKWSAVGSFGEFKKAVLFGREETGKTLRASFRVRKGGQLIDVPLFDDRYYKSKKNPFAIIQKPRERLKAKSEVSEILFSRKNVKRYFSV